MNESEFKSESLTGVWLTQEGYERLQAELENLTTVKRPEIADRIRESQQHGEFSEDNSELDEVKLEQAFVESRIGELKVIFAAAQVLTHDKIPTDVVGLGSVVTLEDPDYGDFEIQLVSSIEADPSRDILSDESPMGAAMLGKREGEVVKFMTPEGQRAFKIKKIQK
ncbi:MAG: transcription elongation factor GreA [Armatimonadetes bacterium]|nr:transcription elongation factor GreA [Armatimonadota bacterium]